MLLIYLVPFMPSTICVFAPCLVLPSLLAQQFAQVVCQQAAIRIGNQGLLASKIHNPIPSAWLGLFHISLAADQDPAEGQPFASVTIKARTAGPRSQRVAVSTW